MLLLLSASGRCTKSVLLKVHSLRQLGKEKLTFGDSYDPEDLSYVDFKVRSVIMGEDSVKLKVRGETELKGRHVVMHVVMLVGRTTSSSRSEGNEDTI